MVADGVAYSVASVPRRRVACPAVTSRPLPATSQCSSAVALLSRSTVGMGVYRDSLFDMTQSKFLVFLARKVA